MTALWKPTTCDCGANHPSWSLNGTHGPWRCHNCHELAVAVARSSYDSPRDSVTPAHTEWLLL